MLTVGIKWEINVVFMFDLLSKYSTLVIPSVQQNPVLITETVRTQSHLNVNMFMDSLLKISDFFFLKFHSKTWKKENQEAYNEK